MVCRLPNHLYFLRIYIISDNTPWNDLQKKGLGWNVSLCPYEIACRINEFYKLNTNSRINLLNNCKKFISEHHYTKIAELFNRYSVNNNLFN